MKAHKHLHLARRKMGHIIDELYTALLHFGSDKVDLSIAREDAGLRLTVHSDFQPARIMDVNRMCELLQPAIRNEAMVEMYWELAGEDQYTSESEMALVGQMADSAVCTIESNTIKIEIYVGY